MENLDELTLLLLRAPRISFVYKQAKDVQTPEHVRKAESLGDTCVDVEGAIGRFRELVL